MPSETVARPSTAGRPKLALAALSVIALGLSACADGPTKPPAPLSSGNLRPDPTSPPRPGQPLPPDAFANPYAQRRSAYVPRHLAGAEATQLKRIGVLLPFQSTDEQVRKEARGLFNAIQLAVFDSGQQDVILMPRDASGDADQVRRAAEDVTHQGAVAIIGPLFSQHVGPVGQKAREVQAPVFAFSTDQAALNQGAYLVSLTPASEVQRIVEYAATQGVTRFAMLGPNTAYGRAVEAALRVETAKRNALVIAAEYYAPGEANPQDQARRVAQVVNAENAASPGKVAVLIPERGIQLRRVAPLLAFMKVDTRQVKLLGTGSWNDPEVWREPGLFGGLFPAPDPKSREEFDKNYRAAFNEAPSGLASFGYDAGALASALARVGQLDAQTLQRYEGFRGINGLFRFREDGSVERGLAVMAVQTQGQVRTVSQPLVAFTPGT